MPTTATKALIAPRAARLRVSKPHAAAAPQPLVLSVVDIIGNKLCLIDGDAKKIFNLIHRAFKKQQPVEVSFHGADLVVMSFMQLAIGKLYEKYEEKEIRPLLKVTNLDDYGADVLARAVEDGKRYFADPVGYTAYMKQIAKQLRDEGYL